MRSLPTTGLLTTAAALLLGGAAALAQDPAPDSTPPAAPTPAPTDKGPGYALRGVPYFPLDEGRRWVYRLTYSIQTIHEGGAEKPPEAPKAEHRLDAYVAPPQELGGKKVAVLEWKLDQELAQRAYYRVEEGVLRCLRRLQARAENVKEFGFEPAQPVCPFELAAGAEWKWEGKNGPEEGKQTWKVLREEEVETRAGKFKALVLETKYEGEADTGTMTRWLVKDVGIVKEVSEVKTPLHVIRTEGSLIKFEGKKQ